MDVCNRFLIDACLPYDVSQCALEINRKLLTMPFHLYYGPHIIALTALYLV
jgi:hypothetical protein